MLRTLLLTALAFTSLTIHAQFSSAPAFPGADGYGRYATGGRNDGSIKPRVLHVTTLLDGSDSDVGTLRYALCQKYPRIVVFDVSGTIELLNPISIAGSSGDVTILGQTAPGDGICISNHPIHIEANNVIMRYLRFRLGDVSLTEDDALNACPTSSKNDIIIDHCTMSWSTDECGSFYNVKNFTLQWSMLSESLKISVHDKGSHGYGGIWGGNTASFHHNLIAHHDSRNIRFDHDYVSTLKGPVDYINNVVYNWGGNSTYGGESANKSGNNKKFNLINNYYKPGPASSHRSRLLELTHSCSNCMTINGATHVRPGVFYLSGNIVEGANDVNADNWKGVEQYGDAATLAAARSTERQLTTLTDHDFAYPTIAMHSADQAFAKVCAYAGTSFHRDAVDTRVAHETLTGTVGTYGKYSGNQTGAKGSTNGLIDTQGDVGGWPELLTYGQLADTDGDGMPDEFEQANGLNKNDPADAIAYTIDKKGYYTNIEVYANQLVEEHIKDQRASTIETFDEYYPVCVKTSNAAASILSPSTNGSPVVASRTYSLLGIATSSTSSRGIQLRVLRHADGTVTTQKGIR